MELFDPTGCLMDDLLDFSSDIGEEDDDDDNNRYRCNNNLHLEFVKEELEWISNKDAFPMVESLVDIMPNHPSIASNYSMNNSTSNHHHHHPHQSPISVLENSSSSFNSHGSRSVNNNSNSSTIGSGSGSGNNNSTIGSGSGSMMMVNLPCSFKVPGKARSKNGRKRRRDFWREPFVCRAVYEKSLKKHSSKLSSAIGRKCLHCGSEKTPQWRAGPLGPKTLCNACGVRYKSGRLCDEYRPASSPTFSSELHSNSHRKIIEMRKQKVPPAVSGLKPPEIG